MSAARVSDADRAALASSLDRATVGRAQSADERFRARDGDDDTGGAFMRMLAAEAAERLEGEPADMILDWAAKVIPRFVITSSFGSDSAVLLHLASKVCPDVPVLFLDTGFHFAETITFRQRLATELGLTVIDLEPELTVAEQAATLGPELYRTDPDSCCGLRKTKPLRQALADYDGWATGVRRVQTPERAATPVIEGRAHAGRYLVKVAPLAAWTDARIEAYLDEYDLPRHPLVAEGYPSIGCAPCTSRVAPGEDPRSGRWAEAGKTECGIHLSEDGEVIRTTTTPG
ncbi:MAG: phosphoadenylyl-sulfate reductase [Nitriliruptorales bacterium]|nr:phosphoadenylyl-sulfate reductase [Nitriliruptorales bacterium]